MMPTAFEWTELLEALQAVGWEALRLTRDGEVTVRKKRGTAAALNPCPLAGREALEFKETWRRLMGGR